MKHFTTYAFIALSLTLIGASCTKKNPLITNTTSGQLKSSVANAFGSLASITGTNAGTSRANEATSLLGRTTTSTAPQADMKLMPSPIISSYVFTGIATTLTETSADVFERNAGTAFPLPIDLQTSAGFGLVNFGSLAAPRIDNLSIKNGDEQWFVDRQGGSISMYLNSTTGLIQPLKTEIPTTTTMNTNSAVDTASALETAATFVTQHGISTVPYDQPVVITNDSTMFAPGIKAYDTVAPLSASQTTTTEGSAVSNGNSGAAIIGRPVRMSSLVQVVYPLSLNGVSVVQQNGDPVGMSLTVDVANQRVTSLSGLNTLDFTKSAYDAITDFSVIKTIAERGGMNGYGGTSNGKTTVNLGTPERVLMSSYLYSDNRSHELYVPALRFPIINPPDTYTTYVVVPLAKDIITPMQPVGMMAPSAGSGSVGSGTMMAPGTVPTR